MTVGGVKTEYLSELGPVPLGASEASFSQRSAAKGAGPLC